MTTFADIVAYLIGILNQLVFIIAGLAVIIFLWGVFKLIRDAARAKKPDRKILLWSLLTLFVMFSIWGILRLMCASFNNICANSGATSGGPVNIIPAGGAYTTPPGPSSGAPGGASGGLGPIY